MGKSLNDKLLNMASAFPATVVIHKAKDGGYWVESPQFAGCFASGKSVSHALIDFKYCLFDYFDIPEKAQNINSLKYLSADFPEPKTVRKPTSMELYQSADLLAV